MTTLIAPPQVLPSALAQSLESKPKAAFNELGCLEDAVETFTKVLSQTGTSAVRLHCSVPTWSPSSNLCLDLHDLNHLRSRSLVFIHNLVNSLQSSGISASYSLAPAHSPLCLVCASSPGFNASQMHGCAISMLQNAKLDDGEHVLLANLERCPSLIII